LTNPGYQADPAAYKLAYEEARRALDEQSQVLTELRSRAGTLIAAAAHRFSAAAFSIPPHSRYQARGRTRMVSHRVLRACWSLVGRLAHPLA
jgi:hypothetical protein